MARFEEGVRVILLGNSGAGKSATGNTILRRNVFEIGSSLWPVTSKCEKWVEVVNDRTISVINTPGIYGSSLSDNKVKKLIEKSIHLASPGPCVFLLVIRLERTRHEECKTIQWIQKNLGDEAIRYTLLLFTGGDKLRRTENSPVCFPDDLQKLIETCGDDYQIFNNEDENDTTQVTQLLEKIDRRLRTRGYYTFEKYSAAKEELRQVELFATGILVVYGIFGTLLVAAMICSKPVG